MIFCKKSLPAPACLTQEKQKSSGDYKCGDVLERLTSDFHGKCYLCESSKLTDIEVEHFRPHEGNQELKFAWENLFLSCGHCNGTKSNKFKNIIDCTDPTEKNDERISYHFNPFPFEKPSFKATDEQESTRETVELLEKIFWGTTITKNLEAANLREALLNEIKDFQAVLIEYFNTLNDEETSELYLIKLKRHLDQGSEFLSFKRWIILNNDRMRSELGHLLTAKENTGLPS